MKTLAAVFGMMVMFPAMALAGAEHAWQTAPGAVTCRSYLALPEAEKSRNDPRWFAETGCEREAGGIPLTIIQPPGHSTTLQVRLHKPAPATVWIGIYDVMGFTTVPGKPRQGPLPYRKVYDAELGQMLPSLIR